MPTEAASRGLCFELLHMARPGGSLLLNQDDIRAKDAATIICIPTCRRPTELKALLDSLQTLAPAVAGIGVIVANNAPEYSETRIVASSHPLGVHYIDVQEPGVSVVRNRLLEEARRVFPRARYFVFIDDDELPNPRWLSELVAVADRFQADLVGGPVRKSASGTSSIWSRLLAAELRPRRPTGLTDSLSGTGNLLIRRTLVERLQRAPFREDFGRTGGEDYEFFRFARSLGAVFAWASEAIVEERWDASRVKPKAVLSRAFAVGAYSAKIDREYDGLPKALAATGWRFAMTVPRALRTLLISRDIGIVVAAEIRATGESFGRIAGLLGSTYARYG